MPRGNSNLVKLGGLYPPKAGGKSVMSGSIQFGPFKFRVLVLNNNYRKNDNDPPWNLFAELVDLRQPRENGPSVPSQPQGFPQPQAPAPQPPAVGQPEEGSGGYPQSWDE